MFKILGERKSGCNIQGNFLGILGHADDTLPLAPSKEALQEMLETCFEYTRTHNLKFSTDPNPIKSKTKCMAFCKRQDENLNKLKLCENELPWVTNAKH